MRTDDIMCISLVIGFILGWFVKKLDVDLFHNKTENKNED
jgi:hypothetical protein